MLDQYARLSVLLALTFGFSILGCLILVVFFKNKGPRGAFEYFLTAIIVGLSFITVVPVLLGAFGVSPTKNHLQIFFLLFLVVLITLLVIRMAKGGSCFPTLDSDSFFSFYVLGLFYLFLIVVRVIQINNIFVPNWVDGLIHTMLLDKLSVSEKISFSRIYHVGFHVGALVIRSFTSLSLSETVLLFGQWLSATCGVTVYLLVRRYTRNLYFSLISLMVYSLFLLFPTYLISWGRYPLLLGLTILPLSMTVSWDWVGGRNKNFVLAFFLVLTLATAHYGTLLVWFSFIFINLVYGRFFWDVQKRDLRRRWLLLTRFFLLIIPLLSFIFLKFKNLLEHKVVLGNLVQRAVSVNFFADFISVLRLVFYHDFSLLVLLVAGVFISLAWKKRLFWLIVFWPVLIGVMTWLQYALLGISISSYLNLAIFFSMPFAVLAGLILKYLYSLYYPFMNTNIVVGRILSAASLLLILFVGLRVNTTIIDSSKILFVSQDYSAMTWIMENTPVDSVFFVESFLWGDKLMPSDGGGWINLLTGRSTVYPKEIGDLYDVCVFIRNYDVDYLYLTDGLYEDSFGLRLSDISSSYEIVYSYQDVMIVSVPCP